VEVLTTCAVDHFTWRDARPAGTEDVNGVPVHRFPVNPHRDHGRWWDLHVAIGGGERLDYASQLEWMGHSVWSEGLQRALEDRDRYDWIIAMPYLFGTTYWAVAGRPERTALISCLHDEPYAWLPAVRAALSSARGCMVSTEGERQLLERAAPDAATALVGVGFDDEPPPPGGVERFCASRGIRPGYLLYAGRREEAKGLPALFAHYEAFRRTRPGAPLLALMGSGDMPVPDGLRDVVIDLGFVPDADRSAAYAGASVLLHPSRLEALGMVLLEAWRCGTPALVNGASRVLREHCRESGGGLWFTGRAEFVESLGLMLDDAPLRERMAAAGARYARERYSWPAVRTRFLDALDAWS
jgi:glycosyltransferase involved in cell wall biosynthesis